MTEPYTAAERARRALIEDAARVAEAGLRKKRLEDAAEEGLCAVIAAYDALVQHPHDRWRHLHQHVYARLRDYIAATTGRDPQEIQEESERLGEEARRKYDPR